MQLDATQYRLALANLGSKAAVFTDPPAHFRNWLVEKGLPGPLVDFLVANSIQSELPFPGGSGGMWTPEDIMELNDQESAILACGLLGLGNAINGDFIVLDLAPGTDSVGFVSHDELWGRNPPADVREIYSHVDNSIHEMLAGISLELREWQAGLRTTPDYPIDYGGALDRELES